MKLTNTIFTFNIKLILLNGMFGWVLSGMYSLSWTRILRTIKPALEFTTLTIKKNFSKEVFQKIVKINLIIKGPYHNETNLICESHTAELCGPRYEGPCSPLQLCCVPVARLQVLNNWHTWRVWQIWSSSGKFLQKFQFKEWKVTSFGIFHNLGYF